MSHRIRVRRRSRVPGGPAACAVGIGLAVAVIASQRHAPAGTAAGTAGSAVTTAIVRGGTLSCSGLEALWESAGGSRGTAFMAAEIAMAESAGHQYSTDLNGGRSTDRGYWQVNSIHGALSTYSAAGNARAAVLLSDDGTDWSPWVTYNTRAYVGQC
jgi:hypothetical protein